MTAESWTTSGGAGSSFFEGWYYKIESADGQTVVVIPGIIFGEVESFAFVMFSAPSVTGSNRRIALYRQDLHALWGQGDTHHNLTVSHYKNYKWSDGNQILLICLIHSTTDNFRYPIEEFEAKSAGDTWAVRFGGSEFRADGFELSLDGDNQAWISFAELVELRHHLG